MREILEGIFTWPWFSQRNGYDFNGYLVRLAGGSLCVDPVEMTAEVLDEIERFGVQRIVLTNRNHFRASMKVQERTGAPIAIHPADAAFAREKGTRIDEELRAGQRVGPLEVVLPTVPHLYQHVITETASWPMRPRIVVESADKQAAFRVARAARREARPLVRRTSSGVRDGL